MVADARGAQIRVEEPYPDREPPQPVTLAVSLPDGGRTDDLVSVLAELGVWCLVPLLGERTPPGRGDMVARRMERWTRLVREAAKVNGRSRLLRIAEPMALREVLAEGPAVMLDPDPEAPTLASRLPASGPLPSLLVGPEGGFTPREVEAAAEAGAERARLGRPALRTATAAIAAAVLALARE